MPGLRVPVPDGSITDFTAVIPGEVTVEQVNPAFAAAAAIASIPRRRTADAPRSPGRPSPALS